MVYPESPDIYSSDGCGWPIRHDDDGVLFERYG